MTWINIFSASYNKYDTVLDTLNSVLNQDYKNFFFLLNENSTDKETRQLVIDWFDEHNPPNMDYVINDYDFKYRNKFAPPHPWLNEQMEILSGDEYILWLADDDYLMPGALSEMAKFIDETNHKIIYWKARVDMIYPDGTYQQGYSFQHSGNDIGFNGPNPNCLIDAGSALIKRECLDEIRKPYYDPYRHIYHKGNYDGEFFEKLAQHYTFYNLDKVLCVKRQTPRSFWHPTT